MTLNVPVAPVQENVVGAIAIGTLMTILPIRTDVVLKIAYPPPAMLQKKNNDLFSWATMKLLIATELGGINPDGIFQG